MKKLKKILSITLLFSVMLAFGAFKVHAATQLLEIHHIKVGQGDSTYVELPDGTDILIDAGKSGAGTTVVNYLKAQEPTIDIEYLIATHPDADHVGGMQSVFNSLKVKNFLYPTDTASTTITWTNVVNLAKKEGCVIANAASGKTFNIAGVIIKFIQPNTNYSTDNGDSVVTYIDYRYAEILLTGDIDSKTESDMVVKALVPNVDFIGVPHHGSSYSSTLNFVKKADPECAVISVGTNSYGHPGSTIITRYKSIGSKVYRTDLNGTLVYRTDGYTAKINTLSLPIK